VKAVQILAPGDARALAEAAASPIGASLGEWEAGLRTLVQQQLAIAMLRLSDAVPGLLDEPPVRPPVVDLVLPLPAGEKLRLVARLERVA
jgi:hypothetical protein